MLDVYSIPLKYLYYNDENGRIATQINKKYGILIPVNDNIDCTYNNKIAQFIEENNLGALKKTKKSIQKKGQQIYGYVLEDGRIIDGNRRFTAIRQLESEEGITKNFEAVILPFSYDAKADRAQIKRLELAIQMGTEEKLDYDPVDLEIDVFNTVIMHELMTVKDYSNESNISVREINSKIATVYLMQDFLVFINSSESAYHMIKDLKLYNPLYELRKKLFKRFPNEKGPKYEQTKETAFTLLCKLNLTGGDTVREVRDYSDNILSSNINDDFNESIEEMVSDLRDKLEEGEIESAGEYRLRLEDATPELRRIDEKFVQTINQQNRGKNVDNFISEIKEITEILDEIKQKNGLLGNLHFENFSNDQIKQLRDFVVRVNMTSKDLIEVYENEL